MGYKMLLPHQPTMSIAQQVKRGVARVVELNAPHDFQHDFYINAEAWQEEFQAYKKSLHDEITAVFGTFDKKNEGDKYVENYSIDFRHNTYSINGNYVLTVSLFIAWTIVDKATGKSKLYTHSVMLDDNGKGLKEVVV